MIPFSEPYSLKKNKAVEVKYKHCLHPTAFLQERLALEVGPLPVLKHLVVGE